MADDGPKQWFFDLWSRSYDLPLLQRATYRPVHDAVVAALRGTAAGRLLDIGCGTGQLALRLRQDLPRVHVIGCDFSRGMLQRAAARRTRAAWVQGDACRLPFRDGSFDVVTSTEAFHWFPDQAAALREFCRVLIPGGRLLLGIVSPPVPLLSQLAHAASQLVGQPFYWPTRDSIRRQVEAAGLTVTQQHRIFRVPGFLMLPVLTQAVRPPQARTRHR